MTTEMYYEGLRRRIQRGHGIVFMPSSNKKVPTISHEEIDEHVAKFLADGNSIEVIPTGESGLPRSGMFPYALTKAMQLQRKANTNTFGINTHNGNEKRVTNGAKLDGDNDGID